MKWTSDSVVGTPKTMHLNAIGNRSVSYNQESFVTAYYDVLVHGFTITKAGFQQIFISFVLSSALIFNFIVYFC